MEFSTEPGLLRVRITEARLDAAHAPLCKQAVETHVTDRPLRVLVDARSVEFIDSSGLGVLVFLLKQMGEGGKIVIAEPRPAVRRLFQMTKLDSVFELTDSLERAAIALGA
jgi:anti-sigma B factor antagonist